MKRLSSFGFIPVPITSSASDIQDKKPRIDGCQPSSSTAQSDSPQPQPPTSKLMPTDPVDIVRKDIGTYSSDKLQSLQEAMVYQKCFQA